MPISAYEGHAPYIFISYAHKDSQRVLPILEALQDRGFRIWYDAGIEAGTEWPEYIAEHLLAAECVIAFITENAIASPNCRQEIFFAMDERKPMLAVFLEDIVLSPGMRLRMGSLQAIYRYRHKTEESFLNALAAAKILQACRSEQFSPVEKEPESMETQDAQAIFEQGKRHYDAKEYAEAAECFRIAAQQGHPDAQYYLGNCYLTGRGIEKDLSEAVRWYSAAANRGHLDAQYALGYCHARGWGVKQSHSMAFMWYKKAADSGHAGAINSVAWTYAFGGAAGVKRNKEEAIRLFLINAKRGDQYAIRQLRELGYNI